MAISFDLSNQQSIEFEKFIENVSKKVKFGVDESLLECVEDIQMLSNNDQFLADFIHKELRDISKFQENNSYSIQSLILYANEDYYVRANIWLPSSESRDIRIWQEDLFYYLRAHDHNFPFLTVGYHGKGYTTDLWEYDYGQVIGYPGEKVDIKFLERTTLPKGKAMIYRTSKDIHTQYAPIEYSISLNIILNTKTHYNQKQFIFDTEKNIIERIVGSSTVSRFRILELAGIFRDPKSYQLLEEISQKHSIADIRLKSFEVLTDITKEPKKTWSMALNDQDDYIRRYAKKELDRLG